MVRRLFITLLIVTSYTGIYAQTTRVLENLPPSIKWYQINTPHFKIIYPEGFSEQGQRMANTMEHIYEPASASLGVSPKKGFPVVLQNQTAVSNGFVTVGPRRSEFFTMSPQRANFLGNLDWLDLLALHEYRHIVQYDKSRIGFTGFVRNVLGEFSQAAVSHAAVPSWYWEGDAVGVETALSNSGRGRIPQFGAVFRANLLEKGSFNYNKQYLGSYKDFIPNHWVFGYHYATYLKNTYGLEAVENIAERAWARPYIPFSFSFAQKKYMGKKMPETYQDLASDLKTKWEGQLGKIKLTSFTKINSHSRKVFTNYDYPQILDNGNILVLKSGLGDYTQFVEIDVETGAEAKRFVPGIMNNAGMLSVEGAQVVWNEYEFDARWRQKSYSVIKSYNVATKEVNKLTEKTRYTSASLSPNRELIVTVEETTDYKNKVVVLNAYSGSYIKSFDAPKGSQYLNPIWTDNASFIVSEINNGTKQIKEIEVKTGEEVVLIEPTEEHISYAVRRGDYLFYVSGWTGIDNIYARDLRSDKDYEVVSSKNGAYNPVISKDGKTMYYNNLTSMGTDVVSIELNPKNWIQRDGIENTNINFFQPMVEMENKPDVFKTIPEKKYEESRYRKKLMKFHSWGPFISDSPNELEAGLYSTNVLSTSDLFLGFHVDTDMNFKWMGKYSYQGFYPIIDVEVDYAFRNSNIPYEDTLGVEHTDKMTWDETTVKAGIRIPWLLTSSKMHTNLEVKNYIGVTNIRNFTSTKSGSDRSYLGILNNGNLYTNEFKLTFYSLLKRSKRDINSKWGAYFIYENYSTPYGGDFDGGLTAVRGQAYLPGLFKHHSFNILGGYQHNKLVPGNNNYWFPNRMPYPRGVEGASFERFYSLRFNYEMPLLYPDISLGPWLYIQRIKTALYYDYGYGVTDIDESGYTPYFNERQYYSTGAELTFDFNFMRALPRLEMGVRYAYWLETGKSSWELLIGSFSF
ncbi:MAG: hypothetical protein ABFS32_01670 [Bacteroidota bacterium]